MKRLLRFIFIKIPVVLVILSIALVFVYKWLPVYVTPLMLKRSVEYASDDTFKTRKHWVRLERISPELAKCVIASEDNKFAEHHGFDWEEIRKMSRSHKERGTKIRGCSTISQQTAKNVFTFCSNTWLRKGIEAYYTFLIERIWGKERIMEVYLNVAEMGKGIYGADAASNAFFKKPASKLTSSECALITACLPNPIQRNAANPGPYTRKRQNQILTLSRKLAYPDWITASE